MSPVLIGNIALSLPGILRCHISRCTARAVSAGCYGLLRLVRLPAVVERACSAGCPAAPGSDAITAMSPRGTLRPLGCGLAWRGEMRETRRTAQGRCQGCGDPFHTDPRKRGSHWYCAKPECRQASRQASQRRWLEKNPDYFRGPESAVRQRQRRHKHADPNRVQRAGLSQDLIDTQVVESTTAIARVTRFDRPDRQRWLQLRLDF
jgi:hypothetical protein